MRSDSHTGQRIAIIGAGPAGLAAAKYLKQHGFEPVIFEQGGSVGGQWSGDAAYSGVWPAMHTNTSRVMTAFSDLPHAPDAPMHPSNRQMHAYLQNYAREFGLNSHVYLNTRVIELSQQADGWRVGYLDADGAVQSMHFDRAIVASGRYNKPRMPAVEGMASFTGKGGMLHTFNYKQAAQFRGMRVLVAGGSISALEIASELALNGVAVISTQRRQRYVLRKTVDGVPVEHLAFTRFAALAEESFPIEAVAAGLKEFVVGTSGQPQDFGALKPADNILEAGITQNQHFLSLVAEGRIIAKPWLSRIDGTQVQFNDGSTTEVDAIIFGTGFDLHLPFLSKALRQQLNVTQNDLDLYAHTVHPQFPGLAFLGLFDLIGPTFPVLELQARWLTYYWSGIRDCLSHEELQAGLALYQAYGRAVHEPSIPMHTLALCFARLAGVEPELKHWPQLTRALMFGPLSPLSFRLSGPDALPQAAVRTAQDAALFGAVPHGELSEMQRGQLQALAAARHDTAMSSLADVACKQIGVA
ncbi:MAG: NAD(P)-binding domain-containing protein [Steroidobacteraceae bacterium]